MIFVHFQNEFAFKNKKQILITLPIIEFNLKKWFFYIQKAIC